MAVPTGEFFFVRMLHGHATLVDVQLTPSFPVFCFSSSLVLFPTCFIPTPCVLMAQAHTLVLLLVLLLLLSVLPRLFEFSVETNGGAFCPMTANG